MVKEPRYMTAQGKARLEQELSDLESRKWPKLTQLMEEAAHGGDATDNTELMTLQRERELLIIRKNTLQDMLDDVLLIESTGLIDVVQVGSTVVVQKGTEESETYRVVGSAEADPEAGLISNVSPLGRAIIGHRVNELINLKTEDGIFDYRIMLIQPNA